MKQRDIGNLEWWVMRDLEREEELGGPSPSEAIEKLYGRGVTVKLHPDPMSDAIWVEVNYSETSGRWMPQCEVNWVTLSLMLPDDDDLD
jgi:hypothetical protein